MYNTQRKRGPRRGRGYDIRIQRQGSYFLSEKHYALGFDGSLPEEWMRVKRDPTVVRAIIFPSTQRHWRADRRRLADSYARP